VVCPDYKSNQEFDSRNLHGPELPNSLGGRIMADRTSTQETRDHYRRSEVKATILRVSNDSDVSRWAVGDSTGWYGQNMKKRHAHRMDPMEYIGLIKNFRTLYSTLSFYDPALFKLDFNSVDKEQAKLKSRKMVRAYTFGIDIDSKDAVNEHGANIRDLEIKEAVEMMAKFFISKLKPIAPNSIYASFSGGGIYIFAHHGLFESYIERFSKQDDFGGFTRKLADALNNQIDDISSEFYREFPQYEPLVKADSLNNAKRVFKTIFSIHKKHDFAVIPLDVDNIQIDFERATLPLSQDVLDSGLTWYDKFDDDNRFLGFLKPYLENAHGLQLKRMQTAVAAS
jgi:hypothetical protein